MIQMTSKMVGDKEVTRFLNKVGERVRNPEPMLRNMAISQQTSIDKNFRVQGRPRKWKSLEAATLKRRVGGGIAGKILQDKGKLKTGVTTAPGRTVSRTEAKIFPTVLYGLFHQIGVPKNNLVARPFMLFQDPEDFKRLEEIAIDHLKLETTR